MANSNKSNDPKHSKVVTSVPEVQQPIYYKHLNRNGLLRARFSEQPQAYLIRISGSLPDNRSIEISRIYDEYHPLQAVGRAAVEFYRDYVSGKINDISVKQRIIK